MVWRGWASGDADTERRLTLSKRHFFVIEKHVEDVKLDEKHVPDLLAAIKTSYGQFCSKSVNLDPKSQKSAFDPKVKSSKMGLSITSPGCGSGPPVFATFGPARGPNI